jgi:hypothetical protein
MAPKCNACAIFKLWSTTCSHFCSMHIFITSTRPFENHIFIIAFESVIIHTHIYMRVLKACRTCVVLSTMKSFLSLSSSCLKKASDASAVTCMCLMFVIKRACPSRMSLRISWISSSSGTSAWIWLWSNMSSSHPNITRCPEGS